MREPRSRRELSGCDLGRRAPRSASRRDRRGRATDEPLAILGGKPVRDRPFPDVARSSRENDEKAWMEVLRKRTLVPARRRLRQPVRGSLGPDAGRQALPGRRQRHERADHVAGRARESGPATR